MSHTSINNTHNGIVPEVQQTETVTPMRLQPDTEAARELADVCAGASDAVQYPNSPLVCVPDLSKPWDESTIGSFWETTTSSDGSSCESDWSTSESDWSASGDEISPESSELSGPAAETSLSGNHYNDGPGSNGSDRRAASSANANSASSRGSPGRSPKTKKKKQTHHRRLLAVVLGSLAFTLSAGLLLWLGSRCLVNDNGHATPAAPSGHQEPNSEISTGSAQVMKKAISNPSSPQVLQTAVDESHDQTVGNISSTKTVASVQVKKTLKERWEGTNAFTRTHKNEDDVNSFQHVSEENESTDNCFNSLKCLFCCYVDFLLCLECLDCVCHPSRTTKRIQRSIERGQEDA